MCFLIKGPVEPAAKRAMTHLRFGRKRRSTIEAKRGAPSFLRGRKSEDNFYTDTLLSQCDKVSILLEELAELRRQQNNNDVQQESLEKLKLV